MIELLISLLVVCLVLWLISYIVGQIAMPQPLRTGILIVAFVLCVLWLLRQAGAL